MKAIRNELEMTQMLSDIREFVNEEIIKQEIIKTPKLISEEVKYCMNTSGNRLRPILGILCYASINGHWKNSVLLEFCLLTEWFHKVSLVIDDVVDDDSHRKGLPTLHAKIGKERSLLVALTMLTGGYHFLMQSALKDGIYKELVTLFDSAIVKCAEGQLEDVHWNPGSGIRDYWKVVDFKTAVPCELIMDLASRIGQAEEHQRRSMKSYGYHLGRGYQILNDLKNFNGTEAQTGKGEKKDIGQNRPNIITGLINDEGLLLEQIVQHNDVMGKIYQKALEMAEEEFSLAKTSISSEDANFHFEYKEALLSIVDLVKEHWFKYDMDLY